MGLRLKFSSLIKRFLVIRLAQRGECTIAKRLYLYSTDYHAIDYGVLLEVSANYKAFDYPLWSIQQTD